MLLVLANLAVPQHGPVKNQRRQEWSMMLQLHWLYKWKMLTIHMLHCLMLISKRNCQPMKKLTFDDELEIITPRKLDDNVQFIPVLETVLTELAQASRW